MTGDCLQRLIMDRELNELSPDTADLLDAYLKDRPGAAAEAAEIRDTLNVARQAAGIRRPSANELPPLQLNQPRPLAQTGALRWGQISALAACLIVGFWLGRAGPRSGPLEGPSTVVQAQTENNDFWSIRRLSAHAAEPSSTPRVRWTSPSAWPQIGDRS